MNSTTVQADLNLPLEVDYQYYPRMQAIRERGGLAISPAEHSYVEVSRVCLRVGDNLVDITGLLEQEAFEQIEDKILAMEED